MKQSYLSKLILLLLCMVVGGSSAWATDIPLPVGTYLTTSEANQAVALKAAQESIVLMKNDKPEGSSTPLLPLTTDKKVALIGPYANAIMLGDYSGTPTYTTTPYQAISAKLNAVTPNLKPNDGIVQAEDFSEAIKCQEGADKIKEDGRIGSTRPGDKLRYDNVNFGKNGATLFAMSCGAKNTGQATLKFYLDDATEPFLTVDNKDTGGWTSWTTVTAPLDGTITGKHNVTVEFVGKTYINDKNEEVKCSYCGNYDWFRFYRPAGDGTVQFEEYTEIVHSSTSASKIVKDGHLDSTKPGDIFRYDNVNFGTDATTLVANLSVGKGNVATLSFYVDITNDDTTTDPVAVINTEDTGGWDVYKDFTATLATPISGMHSVIVKITGEKTYGGNLDWFRFYNPNTPVEEEEPEEVEVPTGQQLYMYATSSSVNDKASDEAIALAKRLAEEADVVIFVGGTDYSKPADHATGTEGHDRWILTLPGNQENVLKEIYEVNKNLVLVLESGSSLDITWAKENIPAIMEAWYGGQAQGQAICDAIYGDINPSGKLTSTWYNSISELPAESQSELKRGGMLEYNIDEWGYTYMYYGKSKHQTQAEKPMFPFGFGLSYTTFEYSDLQAPASIGKDEVIKVKATIRNTGERDGAEVVQLYANYNGTGKQADLNRKLIGFERVELAAGESKEITIEVPYRQFSYYDEDTHQYKVEGRNTTLELAASSADIRLTQSIQTAEGVAQETYLSEGASSIPTVQSAKELAPTDHVYNVIGAYVCPASEFDKLPKGIYVLNGHKFIKK